MIRILYMSDLHLEMERLRLATPGWPEFLRKRAAIAQHPPHGPVLADIGNIDLVVLAGDIHKGLRGIVYAQEVAAYLGAPVVYVAGNHEYYFHDVGTLLPSFRKVNAKLGGAVQFLENAVASYEIRGRRLHVLACTLWTDYALNGDPAAAMAAALRQMNDHRAIYLNGRPFLPVDAAAMHERSVAWLRETLAKLAAAEPDAARIIVTHHAPDRAFLGERVGVIAPCYASNIAPLFAEARPDLWIHGHTHFRHETVGGGIAFVSAPRGYVTYDGEAALRFRPGVAEM